MSCEIVFFERSRDSALLDHPPQSKALTVCRLFTYMSQEKEPKTLIHPLTFSIKPREMVAIMGASGAGKSTLLDILAQRIPFNKASPGRREKSRRLRICTVHSVESSAPRLMLPTPHPPSTAELDPTNSPCPCQLLPSKRYTLYVIAASSSTNRGGDSMILSPGISIRQPLRGIGPHHSLHDGEACPELNFFHQGVF